MNPVFQWKRRVVFIVMTVLAGPLVFSAMAQEPVLALAVSKGTGTVYIPPTHVVFRLHATVTADTMEASLKASGKLEEVLREFMVLQELRPSTFEVSAPAILSVEGNTVRSSAELRFSMAPYAGGEAGAAKLGALCDVMQQFAQEQDCVLSKPDFVSTEKDSVIRNAVHEATKNAYTAAAASAAALGATISAVDTVEVGEITWNGPADTEVVYPTVEQIACTAEARLTYLLEYP